LLKFSEGRFPSIKLQPDNGSYVALLHGKDFKACTFSDTHLSRSQQIFYVQVVLKLFGVTVFFLHIA